ncbi:MAG: hypothetical protein IPL79_12165 [Myxococcales bacterium]|nr:hypothetical protein [Myxococcales bacterium]
MAQSTITAIAVILGFLACCGDSDSPCNYDDFDYVGTNYTWVQILGAKPGESLPFSLSAGNYDGSFARHDFPSQCASWTATYQGSLQALPDGVLHVAPDAISGAEYRVVGTLRDGSSEPPTVGKTVYVYSDSDDAAPLRHSWREEAQISCADGSRIENAPSGIPELVFYVNGEFSVTWTPFEVYYDYFSTFTFDAKTATLALAPPSSGNNVPNDFEGESGSIEFLDDHTIQISSVWFGSQDSDEPTTPTCGYVFSRR